MAVILDIRSEGILDIFDLQITPMLRTKFGSSVQKKKRKKKKQIFKMAAMAATLDFRSKQF